MLLEKYSVIANSCVGASVIERFYKDKHKAFIEYNNPFIATIILNDEEFIKLCCNYDYYLSLTPIFGEPKLNTKWRLQSGSDRIVHSTSYIKYPVYHLGDVEVHCIHDDDEKHILKKFTGRYEIGKHLERMYIWSAAEIFNLHTEEERKDLVSRFLSLKGKSIFLTNKKEEEFEDEDHISLFVEKWEGCKETSRRKDFLLSWIDQGWIADKIHEIIKDKFGAP